MIPGQSQKEKEFMNKIIEKNRNRERLPRGKYCESEIKFRGE